MLSRICLFDYEMFSLQICNFVLKVVLKFFLKKNMGYPLQSMNVIIDILILMFLMTKCEFCPDSGTRGEVRE